MEKNEQLLHEKFVKFGANAKEWMRKCVLLLPEVNRYSIWKKKGFGSIYEYAAKLAGMSRNTVEDALRILEKIEDKPNLRLVAEQKGLGAVRPVVSLATDENEKFWARKAASMSKNTLETYVREFKRQEEERLVRAPLDAVTETTASRARPGTDASGQEEVQAVKTATVEIKMDLDKTTAEMLLKLKGSGDWNTLMQELLRLREEKLAAEEPIPVVNAKRYIPARIKHHVLQKTNGQCAYPGCTKPHKILHHTRRFILEPTHDSKTLVPLCTAHERLAHQGLIEHEQGEPESWRVRQEADRDKAIYAVDRRVMQYRRSRELQNEGRAWDHPVEGNREAEPAWFRAEGEEGEAER